MGKLLSIFTLVFCFSALANQTIIISDLDDTIKITYSHRTWDAVFKGMWSKKVFTGNTKLYNGFKKYTSKTVVLTASYDVLEKHIRETLRVNYIPYDNLIMRRAGSPDSFTYKYSNIKYILDNTNYDVILLGDNISQDHNVYNEIIKNYPQRVIARYIRPVTENEIPKGIAHFYTAYDVAVLEYFSGRMSLRDVQLIGKEIVEERNITKLIPKTFHCPAHYLAPGSKARELFELSELVTKKIKEVCDYRNAELRYGPVQWHDSDF